MIDPIGVPAGHQGNRIWKSALARVREQRRVGVLLPCQIHSQRLFAGSQLKNGDWLADLGAVLWQRAGEGSSSEPSVGAGTGQHRPEIAGGPVGLLAPA